MVSSKSKERVIVNEENNIWVERDFLQLIEYEGNFSKRVAENEEIQAETSEKKPKFGTLDLSLALPGSSGLQQSSEPSNNNTRIGYFRNGSLSSCYSHPFSHNLSYSLTLSSTEDDYDYSIGVEGHHRKSDQIRYYGKGINLYSSLGESSLGLGCQLVNKERCDSDIDRISSLGSNSFFPFGFPARPTIDGHESGDSRGGGLASSRVSGSGDAGNALQTSGPERILIAEELPHEELGLTMAYLRGGLKVVFERCPNMNCKRVLAVDDCKCKICSRNKGFCNVCMCQVCSNFDSCKNTCSWVGCDACSHWCHAACAIQRNLIKSGSSINGPSGTNEMQFHCLGCGQASEMFGFAREAYMHCAKDWGEETLIQELDTVRQIFHGSEDFKGKELHAITYGLHNKLEKKMISPSDACDFILHFFKYTDGLSKFFSSSSPASIPVAAESSFYIMSSSNERKGMITADHPQNDAKDPSLSNKMTEDECSAIKER